VKGWSKDFQFDVYQDGPGGSGTKTLTSLNAARTWSGVLPTSGTWKIDVYGAEKMDHQTKYPYTLVLTIGSP
jgi:hypothetical protein